MRLHSIFFVYFLFEQLQSRLCDRIRILRCNAAKIGRGHNVRKVEERNYLEASQQKNHRNYTFWGIETSQADLRARSRERETEV